MIDPREASPENPERWWREHLYQPGTPQLTVRAVLVGMAIGAVMCLSNLYVFFKTGWSMGVTITAAILSFSIFQLFHGVTAAFGAKMRPLGALENNALITVSSGAGFMTGGGNMAAFGALLMVTTLRPNPTAMIFWFGAIAALGVFTAIPIKRQLINQEGLAFPTGKATAETLRAIHGASDGSGGGEGLAQARALGLGALFAAAVAWFRDAKAAFMPFNLPGTFPLGPLTIGGRPAGDWTMALKTEVVLVGAGALMSFRTGWSLLLGGVLTYCFLAPALVAQGVIATVSYKGIVAWTVWPGAAILVASGLTSFALDWKSVSRSFSGMAGIFGRKSASNDPMDEIECPGWWFPAGFVVLGPIVVILMTMLFQIPWWAGLIAVPLAVVMGFVAARVTGETDVTPTKALGPVTQLLYGAMTPGNLSGNIMSANVTGGIGLHAADLLTTLKTGWMLGASPRVQFYAQLFGVLAGAAVVVPAFNVLIPDPTVLGTDAWPAPSCLVWAGVSKAFAGGVGALDGLARTGIGIGLALGVTLALLERFAPKPLKTFVPSPSGLGIAMVVPGSNAIAMFIGALGAKIANDTNPEFARKYVVPVSSGLIAGESLMGVAIAMLIVAGFLHH
ncbi:MAG: OPT family oligopeptide transporter [Candidatus Eisenbacteria bacterium]